MATTGLRGTWVLRRGHAAFLAAPMRTLTVAATAFAGLFAVLALISWPLHEPRLRMMFPDAPLSRFNASLAVFLIALAWVMPRIVGGVLSAVAAAVGVLTLFEHLVQHSIGIDQLFVADPGGRDPGRMSVVTAAACLLLALSHLAFVTGRTRWTERIALLMVVVSAIWIVGYSYDVTALTSSSMVSRVAMSNAVSFFALAVAALCAVPDGSMEWACISEDAGADLVRVLLPVVAVVIPTIGFLGVRAEKAGWFSGATTSAVIVVLCSVLVGAFTWIAARRITRYDRRRAQAIAELTELRIDLEHQAQERASQLRRRHNEIAVLEDRQRIAADLHDIVIQRLFAAGMYLQSGAQDVDPATRRRLDDAVETMDTAIKDLRASIFELGSRVIGPIDITQAVSDVCSESARVLGFEPDVLIDDPDGDAENLHEDLLAVLREALANVARHAEATAVDVVLRVGDSQIWLTVTDNGKGIGSQAHRSGTRNMELRAREYGGDCTWTALQPRGTKVLWRVPVVREKSMA